MTKPKAIFIDIDGTLFSHKQKQIPESAREAIHYAKNKGALTFVATGRHMRELDKVPGLEGLPIDGFVTLNGGYCVVGGKVVYKNPLPVGAVKAVVERLEENPFPCMFCDEHGMFITMINDRVETLQDALNLPMSPMFEPKKALETEVLQIVTYGWEEESFFRELPGAKVTSWLGYGFDVVNSTTNKWDGILHVLEGYGIDPADAAAIGDADNDREMLAGAGYSIAMGNAEDDVKACAKFVTSHIDDDGFMKAIEHLYD